MKKHLLLILKTFRIAHWLLPVVLLLFSSILSSFTDDENDPGKQVHKSVLAPLSKSVGRPFDADPIKFTLQCNKRTALVGEEVVLTITAHYLSIPSTLLFTAAGSTAFRLKVLLPDGFVQTGGDYTDYTGTELSTTKPIATYTLKGYFSKSGKKTEFRLLRSHGHADVSSLFIEKARLPIQATATDLSSQQSPKGARLVTGSNGEGFIDGADCNTANGWAADRAQLNTSISLDFYIDGQYAGSVQANQSRPDVGAYLGDNGNHGFAFTIPQQFRSGGNHSIEARFSGTSQGLNSGAKAFSCSGTTTTNPPTGNCSYSEGQFLFTTSWGESVYAHYYNGVLYAAYQDGSNFRPQHWLTAAGYDTSKASCFAENDPHTSTPTTNPNPTTPTDPPVASTCLVTSPRASVDVVNQQGIHGWALDASDFSKTVLVDIYFNGTKVASVPANDDRSDLVGAFGNNAAARYHGFNVDMANLTYNSKSYTITIQICGTANPLWSGQVNFSARSTPVSREDDPEDPVDCGELPEVVVKAKKIKWGYPTCTKGTGSGSGTGSGPGSTQPPVTDIPPETTTGTPSTGTTNGSGSGGLGITPNTGSTPDISFTNQPIPTTANLDGVDCDKINGWAFANNGGYANLDIYLTDPSGGSSGRLIKAATIKANMVSRSDVRKAYNNNPNIPLDCGFVWAIPDAYKTGQPMTVKVVPANNISPNGDISRSPMTSSGSCSKPVTTTPSGTTGKPLSWKDFPNFKYLSDQYFLDNYALVGPERPMNIAERLKCFGSVPSDSKYQYSVTMYVDQPVNNTREIAKFSVSPTERRPGHTYFGLERYDSNTGQIVRLVAGFYVETEWKAAMGMVTKGAWGDDGRTEYDISLKVPLTASQFKEIKYKIEASGVPNYSLVQNNCSSFTYNLISPCINLPAGSGAIGILGVGINPADLGQDLRENANAYSGKITIADNSISPSSTNCN